MIILVGLCYPFVNRSIQRVYEWLRIVQLLEEGLLVWLIGRKLHNTESRLERAILHIFLFFGFSRIQKWKNRPLRELYSLIWHNTSDKDEIFFCIESTLSQCLLLLWVIAIHKLLIRLRNRVLMSCQVSVVNFCQDEDLHQSCSRHKTHSLIPFYNKILKFKRFLNFEENLLKRVWIWFKRFLRNFF